MGTALEAFRSYTRAFGALDARSAASHFAEPSMMVNPHGVFPHPDRASVERGYAKLMGDLAERAYDHTEFADVREQRLADNLVQVTGKATWINKEGKPWFSFGMTYTLRRADDVWRIVVAIVHDA